MKLHMRQANLILGIGGILGGLVIVALAFVQKLPFTKQGFPGPGFFPIMCGIAIMLCSLAILFEARKKNEQNTQPETDAVQQPNLLNRNELKTFAITIGISWAVVFLSKFLGLLASVSIAVAFLIRVLGKESFKTAVLVGAGTFILLFLIFDVFLRVPMPTGIFKI